MFAISLLLASSLALVSGELQNSQKIVGGSTTTINQYPFASALLYSSAFIFNQQACGGSILNNRAILSAAHCFINDLPTQWLIRVGSSYSSSGGHIHTTTRIINHPDYNTRTLDNDIAILHTGTAFSFSNTVSVCSIAGSSYNLADNQAVWAIGWGVTSFNGNRSEQLRHVQIWTVNQSTCTSRYTEIGYTVTANMLCSGWLDVGGLDQCQYDSGGPLIHNNVVVGVCSWGFQCGHPRYPGVNARVSRYTSWIQSNA